MNRVIKLVMLCAIGSASTVWADGEEFQALRNSDGSCLDASPKGITVHHCQGLPTQNWKTTPAGDGFMKLSTEANPELCLDIINDGTNNQVQLAKCTNASGQGWKIKGTHSFRISSQWRGDSQCLVYLDGKPQVAGCTEGQHSWTVYAVASSAAAAEAEGGYDGMIDSTYSTDYEFAMRFDKCKTLVPDEANGTRVFRCRRKDSDILCTLRSAPTASDVFSAPPRLPTFRAPVSKDTTGAIMFATPKGKMSFAITPRTGKVTLKQEGIPLCKGTYHTHEQWLALGKKYLAAHPEEADDAPTYTPSTSSAPKGPVRNAPGCLPRDTSLGKNPQSACCALSSKLRKGDRVCD